MAQDEVGTTVPEGSEVAQQVPTPSTPEAADTGVLAEQPGQKKGSAGESAASEPKAKLADRLVPPGVEIGY
jgi:hypothetical protein